MRYLIYCDESDDKGPFYSNFYGGVLLLEQGRLKLEARLEAAKGPLAGHEFKWTKIAAANEGYYLDFARTVLDMVRDGQLKIRIMFTQNINQTDKFWHNEDNQYFLLYYQFLKHAFGLQHCNATDEQVVVSVFLDDIPHNRAKFDNFKDYLCGLTKYPPFFNSRVAIPKPEITAINSKHHVILQAVDVIMGAMQFRLNEKHLEIPKGQRNRGKRTRCKERVFKEISRTIRAFHPHFNIGTSTGQETPMDRWNLRYAHWLFVPTESVRDVSRGKRKTRKRR